MTKGDGSVNVPSPFVVEGSPSVRRASLVAAAVAVVASGLPLVNAANAAAPAISHRPLIPGPQVRNTGWSSSNWSGYAKSGTYTQATAQWVVPSVSPTRGSSYSSAWVG